MVHIRRILLLALAAWFGASPASAVEPAVPLDPVEAVLAAFDDHRVVALGEGNHGNLPGHAFRLKLLADPRFPRKVQDIVVEFGNSRYQDVIDRYVRGDEVARDELRKVWQDTAQANPVWDVPIYEEFFRLVRERNARLPRESQLRVVLGDVPFDWSAVRTVDDYNRQPQRNDAASAAIIQREVLDRGRKGLVIFGDMHFLRRPVGVPADAAARWPGSIVSILESRGVPVFSIYTNSFLDLATVEPATAAWQTPRLARLAGTTLGRAAFVQYQPVSNLVGGQRVPVTPDQSPAMEEQFDAVLHLGPPSGMRSALPDPALCADEEYLAMRFFRMELVGMGATVAQARQYCAAISGGARPD